MYPINHRSDSAERPGGFWQKNLALGVDSLILTLFNFTITLLSPFQSFGSSQDYLIYFIFYLIYFTSFIGSNLQSTPGGLLVGLKVQNLNGENIGMGRSFIRALVSIPSAMFLCLGYIISLFNQHNQTLHDLASGSFVVTDSSSSSSRYFLYNILFSLGIPVIIAAFFMTWVSLGLPIPESLSEQSNKLSKEKKTVQNVEEVPPLKKANKTKSKLTKQVQAQELKTQESFVDNGAPSYFISSRKKIRSKTYTKQRVLSILKNHGKLDINGLRQSGNIAISSINYEQFVPLSTGGIFIRKLNNKLEILTKNGLFYQLLNIDIYQSDNKRLNKSRLNYNKMISRTYTQTKNQNPSSKHAVYIFFPLQYTAAYFSDKDRVNTAHKTKQGTIIKLKKKSKVSFEFLISGRQGRSDIIKFVPFGVNKNMIEAKQIQTMQGHKKIVKISSRSEIAFVAAANIEQTDYFSVFVDL